MKYTDFYSELGKLMYAIAKADGKVGNEEYNTLKKIVREELLPLEKSTDEYGTDNAFYTEMEFDYLEDNYGDPILAFNSFIDYVEAHKSTFNEKIVNLIKRISSRIASSEFGIDANEQKYLDKLNQKLKGLA